MALELSISKGPAPLDHRTLMMEVDRSHFSDGMWENRNKQGIISVQMVLVGCRKSLQAHMPITIYAAYTSIFE